MDSSLNKSILVKLNEVLPQNLIPTTLNNLDYIMQNNTIDELNSAVEEEELVYLKGGDKFSEEVLEEVLSIISSDIIPHLQSNAPQSNVLQPNTSQPTTSNDVSVENDCDMQLDLNLDLDTDADTISQPQSVQTQQTQNIQPSNNDIQQNSMEVEFSQFVQQVVDKPKSTADSIIASRKPTSTKQSQQSQQQLSQSQPQQPQQPQQSQPQPSQQQQPQPQPSQQQPQSQSSQPSTNNNEATLDISKLTVGSPVTGTLYCTSCRYKETADFSKQLTLYCIDDDLHKISCRLKSSKLDTTVDFSNTLISIIGNVKDFHGEYIEIVQLSVLKKEVELPSPTIDNLDEYVKRFDTLVKSISNIEFKNLLEDIFYRNGYLEYYKKKASSISMHGTKAGDLLKHCVLVAEIADKTIDSGDYDVDRDLVITSALLHDIGKVYQMPKVGQTEYTLIGNLYGHIFMGSHIVLDLLSEGRYNIPSNKVMNIVHCLLSHHGKLEYGSPVEPCTPEAVLLNQADLTEAYMRHIVDTLADKQPQQQVKDFGKHIVKL